LDAKMLNMLVKAHSTQLQLQQNQFSGEKLHSF